MTQRKRLVMIVASAAAIIVVSLTYSLRAFADLARLAAQPGAGSSTELVLGPAPTTGQVSPASLAQARQVIVRRLHRLQVGDRFEVTLQDARLLVKLPPSENMSYITSVLTSRGEVEFIDGGPLPPLGITLSPEAGAENFPVLFTGDDIQTAQPPDPAAGQIFYRLTLQPIAAQRLNSFVAGQSGSYLCMALDGQVLTCSRMYHQTGKTLEILPELSSGAMLSLTDVGIFIESGPLPWPLTATSR